MIRKLSLPVGKNPSYQRILSKHGRLRRSEIRRDVSSYIRSLQVSASAGLGTLGGDVVQDSSGGFYIVEGRSVEGGPDVCS